MLQLVLEKVLLAVGGMFMLVGAGLHISKEVGWLVSKGAAAHHSALCIPLPPRGGGVGWHATLTGGLLALSHTSKELPAAGVMFPPTKADWKSPKFWMNWTTWWVSCSDAFHVFTLIDKVLL